MGVKQIIKKIEEAQHILVLTHKHPDPDAIGSAGAFVTLMKQIGKDAIAFTAQEIKENYNIEHISEHFEHKWPDHFNPDIIVTVDVADPKMLEDTAQEKLEQMKDVPLINIDHHPTNPKFGTLNWIAEPQEYSSAAEMVYDLAKEAQWPLTKQSASYLLLGIIGDTGRFVHKNATAKSLRAAADLMDAGANLYDINLKLEKCLSLSHIKFWAEVSGTVKTLKDGKVIWTQIPNDMLHKYAEDIDTVKSDLMNFFLYTKKCHFSLIFTEHNNEGIGISLRSTDKVNCLPLAQAFGGGGHKQAAGCGVAGSLQEVKETVLAWIKKHFEDKMWIP